MTYTPRSVLIVACNVSGCDWRASVSLWALGPTLAASRVQQLLSDHLEKDHPEWNSTPST